MYFVLQRILCRLYIGTWMNPRWAFCWKIWFCISYKTHNGSNKHRSTSFKKDNTQSWILESRIESVPWCNEIQKQNLRMPLINIPIPHYAWEVWSLNQFTCMRSRENKSVRLNFINHLVGFIPYQICLYFSN